jgi:hypothetical protein
MIGHPVRGSKESASNISLPMQDPNHLNTVMDRPEENQVTPDWEHPQAWREIKSGLPHEGHGGQPVQGIVDTVQHTISVGWAVLGNVAPDIN